MAAQLKDPEIRVTLNHDDLEKTEVFANSRQDRDRALRAILNASEEFERLARAVTMVL